MAAIGIHPGYIVFLIHGKCRAFEFLNTLSATDALLADNNGWFCLLFPDGRIHQATMT